MNTVSLALLMCMAVTGAGAADFKAGLDAFNRGDFATALREWEPIAQQGDPNAQYNVALLYARGQGPGDYQKAADWYRKAAEQGVAAAQYNLAVMYANGQGLAKNRDEAIKWLSKAAEQGLPQAASGLGRMYDDQNGNYAEAMKWYQKAAERGVPSAAYHLGVMYDLGRGVPQNFAEALKWYQRAADAGYAPAVANIGVLYYNAQGVKRDLVQAYAWFARAQKLGDARANELIGAVSNKLKPGDIKKAQALAANWSPKPKPEDQNINAKLFRPPQHQSVETATTNTITTPAATNPVTHAASGQTTSPSNSSRAGGVQTATTNTITTPAATNPVTHAASGQPPSPVSVGTADRAASATTAPTTIAGAERIPSVWTNVDRVIAVGDVHGDFEQFTHVLQSAGLIDGYGNWTGGRTHMVQTGDVVGRGPDARAVMDLLMKLEKQAAAAGGGVHCLIGSHEAMEVYGDLRYVSPAEFASFGNVGSGANRTSSYAYRQNIKDDAVPELDRSRWETGRPPGYAEHRAAFGPQGEYGRWIRSHNAIIKIDRTLFVHGGLGEKYADWPLDRINDEARLELNESGKLQGGMLLDQQGPLWYNGLAKGDEAQLSPLVDNLLRHFDVDRIVIGHTYTGGAVKPRFNGKVVLIDVGIPRIYDSAGQVACLEIDRGHPYALDRGRRMELLPTR